MKEVLLGIGPFALKARFLRLYAYSAASVKLALPAQTVTAAAAPYREDPQRNTGHVAQAPIPNRRIILLHRGKKQKAWD